MRVKMATKGLIIAFLAILLNQICHARGITTVERSTSDSKSKLTLTVQELSFILSTRRGDNVKPPRTISPCARAILTCCNGKVINSQCSESMKCGAFFFDDNPCEDKFIVDALNAARTFYEQYTNGKM
ncbi:unnamed protein product, partial [Iphiclides podalirius]